MLPACPLAPPSPAAASAWAGVVALLAHMAGPALAGGALTAASDPGMEVTGSDPRRVEGDARPPRAHGDRICPPVDHDAGPRAHRVDAAPVRPGRAGGPAGLGRR